MPSQSILVVDDDHTDRVLFYRTAQRLVPRVAVEVCSDGDDALRWVEQHPTPSLIVADVHMRRVGGLSLVRALRADPKTSSVPIALLTGVLTKHISEEAQRQGAVCFQKPPNLPGLQSVMHQILQAAGLFQARLC